MSALDEKLINYGGLAHFHDQMINDSAKSDKATWSSEKIDSELSTALAAKQDVISDLATIRSGAALGATALQAVPAEYVTDTELSTALTAKQDVISDLATIRSGAALGATALQAVPAEYVTDTELSTALADKANKADYTIGMTQSSQGAAPELDLSALNSATTDGVYSIVVKTNLLTGTEEFVGFGQITVINASEMGAVMQSIKITYNAEATKTVEITRLTEDGVNWQEYTFTNAVIDDVQSPYSTFPWSTYSATKINQLLAALESRIAALETQIANVASNSEINQMFNANAQA